MVTVLSCFVIVLLTMLSEKTWLIWPQVH